MQSNIQEIYATAIRPLPDDEKLQIATLILEEVNGKSLRAKRQIQTHDTNCSKRNERNHFLSKGKSLD